MITLLYFARLRESFGMSSEQIAISKDVASAGALLDWLRRRGGAWSEELAPGKPVRIAINQTMVAADAPLADGDEVALFPPVTGG
ncbi:MAG: molybdopterin converting factor subunit 1 [Sulfuricella sp.]|nr:molybdopterin converting factor subunit 1 [Sulfuricella sp.]